MRLLALVVLVLLAAPLQAVEPRHADHEALRGMLKTVTDALNTRDLDSLDPLFREKFSVVTVDQKRFTSLHELKKYFTAFFGGEHALLKSVEFRPQADELTDFVSPDVGIAHGTSKDLYHFADGDTREMASRWSAVVVKEKGAWKLASLHVGVDPMDNPILAAAKGAVGKAGVMGGLLGVLAGFLLCKVVGPRRA